MKILFALFLLAPNFSLAADCVDFSGDYSAPVARLPEHRRVHTLRQTGCDSIAVGSYALINGRSGEEINPRILYVNETKRELCPTCVGFKVVKGGIEILANGTIPVKKNRCGYNKVKWSLKGRDISQTYTLTGAPAPCKKAGSTATRVLDRYR